MSIKVRMSGFICVQCLAPTTVICVDSEFDGWCQMCVADALEQPQVSA